MINVYGELAVDVFPLERFGLAEGYPKLTKLQREVAGLDARRLEAERGLVALRQAVSAAREKDSEAAGSALREGKDMPSFAARHEAEAQREVEGAERTVEALEKATSAAAQDLAAEQSKHSAALARDLTRARSEAAQRVSEQASSLLADLALFYGTEDTAKKFAPPASLGNLENAPARDIFMVAQAARPQGPQRGDVEQILAYLAGLAASEAESSDAA